MGGDADADGADLTPSFADYQAGDGSDREGYTLSVVRSRFYPNDRLADEEIGYDLKDLVDARDIISSTDHVAELLIRNAGSEPFPGGTLGDVTVMYGTGVRYESHQVAEETTVPPLEPGEDATVTTPIGPPEAPPMCLVQFTITASDGGDVVLQPSSEGPAENGINLLAPVVDRESLRVIRELQAIRKTLEEL